MRSQSVVQISDLLAVAINLCWLTYCSIFTLSL